MTAHFITGKLEYQAQSPDEGALVSAARNFGFVFKSRTPNSITIIAKDIPETYELLCILDFNNVRKRMSVILKKDGKIRLYCKGADSIIYERLKDGQDSFKRLTQEHLDVSYMYTYTIVYLYSNSKKKKKKYQELIINTLFKHLLHSILSTSEINI
nr:phospholipid-transporting ATPase ID-like [Procambarus clarkii]